MLGTCERLCGTVESKKPFSNKIRPIVNLQVLRYSMFVQLLIYRRERQKQEKKAIKCDTSLFGACEK
jgi:hypothetical protein